MRDARKFSLPIATILAVVACMALLFVPEAVTGWLSFDRQAIFSGQVWRFWTGHLTHFSVQHALVDTSVLFLAGAVAERELGTPRVGLALLVGAPAISAGLLILAPEMSYYRGASGLSMLVAVAGGLGLWRSRPKLRLFLVACGTFLALKVLLETMGLSLDMASLPKDIQVAWQAHFIGSFLGCIAGVYGQRQSCLKLKRLVFACQASPCGAFRGRQS
jgi:rhomboid family GlyGly-CTERM serine protease